MRIIDSINQLHIDPDRIGAFLHTPFQNMSDAELFCDLAQVSRCALIMLCGSARDHLQIGDL